MAYPTPGARRRDARSSSGIDNTEDRSNADRRTHFQSHKWILWVSSMWAARLAFATLALSIPLSIEVYFELSARFVDQVTYSALPQVVPVVPWEDTLIPLFDAEEEATPKVIRGAPVPDMATFLRLLADLYPTTSSVKTSDLSPLFVYRASDRAWSSWNNGGSSSGGSKTMSTPPPLLSVYETVTMSVTDVALKIYPYSSHPSLSNPQPDSQTTEYTAADIPLDIPITPLQDPGTGPYYYMSYVINRPDTHSFVHSAAPYLLRLGGSEALSPEMRLWISSDGAIASWHYDMERNFFVQLTGSKRFLLANADAHLFLKPMSYLHPGWRQASEVEAQSLATMTALAVSYVDEVLGTTGMGPCSTKDSLKPNHHRLNPVCKYKAMLEASPTRSKHDIAAVVFGITEVTLTPGDVLHIPPFVFHCVISGLHSASLNVWMGSKELSVSTKLQNIQFPWDASALFPDKIRAIRYSIMRLFSMLGHGGLAGIEYGLFTSALSDRYTKLIDNDAIAGRIADSIDSTKCTTAPDVYQSNVSTVTDDTRSATPGSRELCSWNISNSMFEQIKRGYDTNIKKSSTQLHSQLDKLSNKISIRNMLLSDYIEDMLDFSYKASGELDSTPCSMHTFVEKCLFIPAEGGLYSTCSEP